MERRVEPLDRWMIEDMKGNAGPGSIGDPGVAELVLQHPAFGLVEGDAVLAIAGVYPDEEGTWYSWSVVPELGCVRLRATLRAIRQFLDGFDKPVVSLVQDGTGYVFAQILGFGEPEAMEEVAGIRHYRMVRRK